MSAAKSHTVIEWGLRHPNGYITWCVSKIEAEGMKSGRIIRGRRGDWDAHELVKRSVTTTWGDPEAAG